MIPQASPPIPNAKIDGLYLHLPFCFHKCHYCDFFSVVEPTADQGPPKDRQEAFTDALIAELRRCGDLYQPRPRTIFAGGGTPTYLRDEYWARLLDEMQQQGVMQDVEEFTVEANPETVRPEQMRMLVEGGVNRVSIGAQSFHRESLKALERWHDPDNVPRAVDLVRRAGIDNFSLDLIFAIPGQTLDMLGRDLDQLLALDPPHLSTYGLTYEPNTSLTARLRVGKVTPVDEDTERQMYALLIDRLEAAGYEHYEISNWAKPGKACQHNLLYWHNKNWIGLGPSAASHLAGHRWKNAANLPKYLAGSPEPPTEDHEQLPPHRQIGETLMLCLRLAEGVALDWLKAALPADDPRHATLAELTDIEMLERTATHLRLTRRGRFVADSVIAKLLD